jgi:hypothetical protein
MSKIKITNANNQHKFICFKIDGLKDGIMVGLYPNNDGLTIAYQEDQVGVPFNANSALIDELNDNSFPSEDEIDNTVVGTIRMSKETYDWLTTSSEDDDVGYWQPDQVTELDDEAFDAFEKEVMNPEPDMERVEAAKKIFEDVDKVINDIEIVEIVETPTQEVWKHEPVVLQNPEDLWKYERTHYGEPHLLELMDEWGINGSNYADFRNVIQEHCFDKGLYAFDDIEKSWKEHQESIKNAVKSIKKNGNN